MKRFSTVVTMTLLFLTITSCRDTSDDPDSMEIETEVRDMQDVEETPGNVPEEVEEERDTDPDNTRVDELDTDELLPRDTTRNEIP